MYIDTAKIFHPSNHACKRTLRKSRLVSSHRASRSGREDEFLLATVMYRNGVVQILSTLFPFKLAQNSPPNSLICTENILAT